VKIDIEKAPAWIRALEGRQRAAAKRGLLSAAKRMVGIIVNEVIPAEPRVPVDRGIYRGAWKATPTEDGAILYNDSPHGVIVEEGARAENIRPGRAMLDALTEWVIRKRIGGTGSQVEARRIAWAIVKSMQKHGIFNQGKGLKIMAKANRRLPKVIVEEVSEELRRAAAKES
jgi:hypothetical protein